MIGVWRSLGRRLGFGEFKRVLVVLKVVVGRREGIRGDGRGR